jgi:phosphoglucosamine mutase
MLEEQGGILGGENSGHIVCLDRSTTGDGIIAALQVLQALRTRRLRLAEARTALHLYPQVLLNVKTIHKVDLEQPKVRAAVHAAENRLNGRGRVLLRPSGTEAVVRVMVEGEQMELVSAMAEDIAAAVRAAAN